MLCSALTFAAYHTISLESASSYNGLLPFLRRLLFSRTLKLVVFLASRLLALLCILPVTNRVSLIYRCSETTAQESHTNTHTQSLSLSHTHTLTDRQTDRQTHTETHT